MTAVEHQDGGTGALVLALVYHQVRVLHVDCHVVAVLPQAGPSDRIEDRAASVDVQGVAEFVRFRCSTCLDTGSQISGVMAAHAALAA